MLRSATPPRPGGLRLPVAPRARGVRRSRPRVGALALDAAHLREHARRTDRRAGSRRAADPAWKTRRIASQPATVSANENAANARAVGAGWRRSVADVTMPRTPSLPTTSGVRSGPVRAPRERDDLAGPGHALERHDHVLDLAVVPGALARAPSRDPAAHGAAQDRRREVPEREASPAELLLQRQPERARLHVEARGALVEVSPAAIRFRSTTTTSGVGRTPPHTPLPAPNGTRPILRSAAQRTSACDAPRRLRPHDEPRPVLAHASGPDVEVVPWPEVARVRDLIGLVAARADPVASAEIVAARNREGLR